MFIKGGGNICRLTAARCISFFRPRHWKWHDEEVSDASSLCACACVCVYAHVRFSGSVLSGHLRAGANIGCVNPQ